MLGKGIGATYTTNISKPGIPILKIPVFYNTKFRYRGAPGYKLTTKYINNSKFYKIKKNFYTIGETYKPVESEAQTIWIM